MSSQIESNIERVKELVEKSESSRGSVSSKSSEEPDSYPDRSGRIMELEKRIESLEIDLYDESMHEEALENRLNELEEKVELAKTEKISADRLNELERDVKFISTKANHVDDLDDQIDAMQNNMREKLQKLNNRIEGLEALHEDLREAVGMLVENEEDHHNKAEQKINNLQGKLEGEISQLKQESSSVKNKLDSHKEEINYLTAHLTELSEAVKKELEDEHNEFTENLYTAQ